MKTMGRPKNEYRFFNPRGELITVNGLREICKEYDLNLGKMSLVHNGKIKHHKGWTTARSIEEISCDHECIIKVNSNIELWIRRTALERGVSEGEVINDAFRDARRKERQRKIHDD